MERMEILSFPAGWVGEGKLKKRRKEHARGRSPFVQFFFVSGAIGLLVGGLSFLLHTLCFQCDWWLVCKYIKGAADLVGVGVLVKTGRAVASA